MEASRLVVDPGGHRPPGAAVYWHQHWHGQFVFGDSHSYFELARAIAHGQPYQLPSGEQVFRAPGYPLLLSPVLWFLDGPHAVWAARIESCLFGSLTVLGRGLVGRASLWSACRMDCRTDHGAVSRGRGHQRPRAERSPVLSAGRHEPGIWTAATVGWMEHGRPATMVRCANRSQAARSVYRVSTPCGIHHLSSGSLHAPYKPVRNAD